MSGHRYPEIELECHRDGSHGSGSSHQTYYFIEVRSSYLEPHVIDKDFVIDFVWRKWPIREARMPGGINIPVSYFDRRALEHGLLSFAAAQAHRWALIAFLEADRISGSLCIETRLVAVKFEYQYKLVEKGVSDKLERGSPFNHTMEFKPRNMPELKPSE